MNGRPAVFYDADGTWYRWQLFDEWVKEAVACGVLPGIVLASVEKERRDYENRKGTFDSFVWAMVRAYSANGRLRGVSVSDARFVAHMVMQKRGERVHVFTRELHLAAERLHWAEALISGSMLDVVSVFADMNRVAYHLGTEHPHENGIYTGGTPKVWSEDKEEAVRVLCERHELDADASVAIGDTASDKPMLSLVRWPICFNPTDLLAEEARRRRWPMVIEKKNRAYFFLPDERGLLRESSLLDFLPPDLARETLIGLTAAGYVSFPS